MAITLNKHAGLCERIALETGVITENSPPRVLVYEISRHWRTLCDASQYKKGEWTEQETEAANIIVTTLAFLHRSGCEDVERLLKDTIWRLANRPI